LHIVQLRGFYSPSLSDFTVAYVITAVTACMTSQAFYIRWNKGWERRFSLHLR